MFGFVSSFLGFNPRGRHIVLILIWIHMNPMLKFIGFLPYNPMILCMLDLCDLELRKFYAVYGMNWKRLGIEVTYQLSFEDEKSIFLSYLFSASLLPHLSLKGFDFKSCLDHSQIYFQLILIILLLNKYDTINLLF